MRKRSIRESVVEQHFVDEVKSVLGGMAQKYKSPSRKNAPDRLAILPFGILWFVELKRPDEEPNDGQLREHDRLRALGHKVEVLDSYETVGAWIDERRIEQQNIRSNLR